MIGTPIGAVNANYLEIRQFGNEGGFARAKNVLNELACKWRKETERHGYFVGLQITESVDGTGRWLFFTEGIKCDERKQNRQ